MNIQVDNPRAPRPAETSVAEANKAALDALPFTDRRDFEDAERGFIGTNPDASVVAGERIVWSQKPYAFLRSDEAPETVHPSLWRIAQLNCRHGLFEVTQRIYQVRGF